MQSARPLAEQTTPPPFLAVKGALSWPLRKLDMWQSKQE